MSLTLFKNKKKTVKMNDLNDPFWFQKVFFVFLGYKFDSNYLLIKSKACLKF